MKKENWNMFQFNRNFYFILHLPPMFVYNDKTMNG